MHEQSSLGRALQELRTAAGLTLADLSKRSGVREAYLASIEADREEPSAATLRRLGAQLGPAGTISERLTRYLTAPEFDPTGEYTDDRRTTATAPAAAAESVWRYKTDLQVVDAAASLDEYTPEGKQSILNELHERGLSEPAAPARNQPDTEDERSGDELQFDRVMAGPAPFSLPDKLAVNCAACRIAIDTEYFDVNGMTCCSACRASLEAAAQTPRGIVPLATAGAFGLGAGLVGATIYYAVIAIANLEIGIIAILIGYMVGSAVRKGARGRGGRRFQILAVALTYASVALAYTPIVVKQAIDADRSAPKAPAQASGIRSEATGSGRATTSTNGGSLVLAIGMLAAFVLSLPVLVVAGSFPTGLISGFIIFIGMRQAWKMTGTPRLQVLGPYRVGPTQMPTPA